MLAFTRYGVYVYFAMLSLVCIATLWLGLEASRLWDRDEPRNARCAVEMLERGDWIVPMFNGQLRTHKPILLYWLQIACFSSFGETDFAARAASALMATIAVLATYWLGKNLIDTATGFWSASALATSIMFVVAGRAATPDACLVATSTLGVVGLVMHWQSGAVKFTRYALGGYLALGLAILAKGPVGIVLPMMVVGIWGFVQLNQAPVSLPSVDAASANSWSSLVRVAVLRCLGTCWTVARKLVLVRGVLIAIMVAAPWYIWVGIRTDGEWLRGFFFEHNIGRAMTAMEGHRGGWWFYPVACLVGLFPWSLLLLPIGLRTAKQVRKHVNAPSIQLGLIWLAVYMIVFSIAKTKLPSYITPSYPGAALLVGSFLAQWANGQIDLSKRWLKIAAGVFALATGLIMSAIVYLSIRQSMPALLPHSLWSLGFLIIAALMLHSVRYAQQQRLPWAMLACFAMFLGGLFAAAGPAVGRYRVDLNAILTQQTYVHRDGDERPTEWIALRPIEPSWIYYLRMPISELANSITNTRQCDDELSVRLAEHLRKPSGRLIVDADEASAIESMLAERYQMSIDRAICFKSFLKSNEIVVLKKAADNGRGDESVRVSRRDMQRTK